ncbi:predicted protein [Nematostella vectensis]|uniref:DH domain-containing protein n=1 Tax=Nematostella vectensis TaxID=45351 RepID=A7SFH2_NEMVE|nr:predicted protein [Nematostella vectensis]|eukprot:XP_001629621.1 predicted protein [Nematostella vectensis]
MELNHLFVFPIIKEALECRDEAHKCRVNHPRKAMSLYLKAGKGRYSSLEQNLARPKSGCFYVAALVLCSDADTALDCFRCLIVLASNQLTKVLEDKKKIPKNPVEEKSPFSRSQSLGFPEKQNDGAVDEVRRNSHAGTVEASAVVMETADECVQEVQEVQDDEVFLVTCVEESTDSMENRPPSKSEAIVVNHCEEAVLIATEQTCNEISTVAESTCLSDGGNLVCEMVECVESDSHSVEYEVAMLDSSDDALSTFSATSSEDIVRTVNSEVVMECCESELMTSADTTVTPEQNALIRRGYVVMKPVLYIEVPKYLYISYSDTLYAVSELIHTEESYIRDMDHVLKGYMSEIADASAPSELKGNQKFIFSNIQDIHDWHANKFYTFLKDCEDMPSQLGDVFTYAESKLEELYTVYCRNKPKSDSLVMTYKDTFFQECRHRLGHRLQITDYLIKPVQRITKYQLLLRAKPDDTGDLILRETLVVADGKAKQKSRECNVFLFEKVILLTEPSEEGGRPTLRFLNSIKVRGLGQTESVDSDPCKWAVWLRKRSGSEIYVLKAPSIEIKQIWMKAIIECNEKKKQGLIKSALNRARTFRRECELRSSGSPPPSPKSLSVEEPTAGRRTFVKRKTSKIGTKKKRGRDASERLKENILKFRQEEQMLTTADTESETDTKDNDNSNSMASSIDDVSTIPPSPDTLGPIKTFSDAVMRVNHLEERARLEAEENQLKKVLLLTRMIAARLLQFKDVDQSLSLYSDVIGSVFPLDKLRKLDTMSSMRDVVLQQCTELYEVWRWEVIQSGDLEESYSSMTSLLNETAGFSSLQKGTSWSVVLYSLVAIAGSREQKWRHASQAFYRLSLVYSSLQVSWCAIDSLLDAHWMCCQAEDHQGAVNFFYNAYIRTLACRDFLRSLRLEQQALFLIQMLNSRDGNNNTNDTSSDSESRGLVSARHLSFLINMSRATRQKDWAWFEIAETELNSIVSTGSGRQADTVLSAVFMKIRRSVGETEC